MKFVLIKLIKLYSFLISPLMGRNCRFYPTCSSYMMQAIENHGAIKGIWLGVRRLLKCHPYYKGDMEDPVPKGRTPKPSHICSKDCTHPSDQV